MGIQHSCNAYFVSVFRDIVDRNKDEETPRQGLDTFNEYLRRFGMGGRLGIDFPGEQTGNIPGSEYYDKVYAEENRWKSIWIRSLGIGQGELLTTNLQLANMAAAIGNKGYYITPHLVKYMRDENGQIYQTNLTAQRKETGIDAQHFPPVVDGMEWVVKAGTARIAAIPGISVCGKTGTAENPHGKDHSIFFAFAPKENPQIAIAVYVENGGWGGSYAAPIASLMIEKYLNGEVSPARQWLRQRMLNADLIQLP
jgi:penicillin-binding protein 2